MAGGGTGTGTGTTSTSTNLLDSDLSQSISRDEDGVRSALSLEQESEICRHRASPERDLASEIEATPRPLKSAGKRMSLGSNLVEPPPARRAPLRSALSVQVRPALANDSFLIYYKIIDRSLNKISQSVYKTFGIWFVFVPLQPNT